MEPTLREAVCSPTPLANPAVLAISILAVLVGTGILIVLASLLVRRIERRLKGTVHYWHATFWGALHAPLLWLIGLMGIVGVLQLIEAAYHSQRLLPYVVQGRYIIGILAAGWLLLRWKSRVHRTILERHEAHTPDSQAKVEFFSKMATLIIVIIVALVLLQRLGFDVTALVAFGGVGGIVVGLAARDTFANLFSGIMLYFTKPFHVGDWIDSPDRQIEGYVEEVGWYTTCIRTLDKRPLYIPNGLLTSIVIRNPGRMSHRQIKVILGLRYEDFGRIPEVVETMRNYLRNHPDIDQDAPVRVHMVNYNNNCIDVQVQGHTKITDWDGFYEIQHNLLLELGKIIEQCGAEFAYPTQTIHLIK
jgi:MscS family membrane protein